MLTFTPGGQTRLNPLTRLGSREMREGLLEAIARAMLERPLTQPEALGLSAALAAADRHADEADVCIPDVVAQLRDPDREIAEQLACSRREAQADLRECALALQRLTHGPLRGMFDQPTRASEQVWDAPAVCLDLSQVGVGQAQSNLAIAIVMVCASAFLDAKRRDRARQARAAGPRARQDDPGQRRVLAGPADPRPRRVLPVRVQALAARPGCSTSSSCTACPTCAAPATTARASSASPQGLLAEASTTVVYRQHAQEVPDTADALGLSTTARERIARLPAGVALWCVGGRCFEVRHVLSDREWQLIDTDAAMGRRRTPDTPPPDSRSARRAGGARVRSRQHRARRRARGARRARARDPRRDRHARRRDRRRALERPPGRRQPRRRARRRRAGSPGSLARPRARLARRRRAPAARRARAAARARARRWSCVLALVALAFAFASRHLARRDRERAASWATGGQLAELRAPGRAARPDHARPRTTGS